MAERVREIRAVYDGKVFVPKESVPIPVGSEVTVDISEVTSKAPEPGSIEALRQLAGSIDAPWYDPASFSREDIYD